MKNRERNTKGEAEHQGKACNEGGTDENQCRENKKNGGIRPKEYENRGEIITYKLKDKTRGSHLRTAKVARGEKAPADTKRKGHKALM